MVTSAGPSRPVQIVPGEAQDAQPRSGGQQRAEARQHVIGQQHAERRLGRAQAGKPDGHGQRQRQGRRE